MPGALFDAEDQMKTLFAFILVFGMDSICFATPPEVEFVGIANGFASSRSKPAASRFLSMMPPASTSSAAPPASTTGTTLPRLQKTRKA
jgi:hypothetical protein